MTLIAASVSARSVGKVLILLAGVAGVGLIAAIGMWLGRSQAAARSSRRAPLGAAGRSLAAARETIARRTHPLVAAALVLVLGIVVAVIVTYAVGRLTKLGVIVHADRPIDHFVDTHRVARVSRLMLTTTLLGSYTVVYTIAITGGLVVWVLSRRWLALLVLVASVPTENLLQKEMSSLVHGAKPAQSVAIGPPGAFFSGGSARTLIVCGLLAYFVASMRLERRQRAFIWTLAALATFVEGFSRLYLGRHFAVDIIGGWVLGGLVLVSFILAADALRPTFAPAAVDERPVPNGADASDAAMRPARMFTVAVVVLTAFSIVTALVVATAGPSLTDSPRDLLVPARGALFGAWVQPTEGSGTSAEEAAVLALEGQLGRKLAIDQLYVQWAAPLPLSVARWDLRQGIVPMISWGGARTDLIAAGMYDAQIRARALQLRDLHQPVLLRWFYEMDGSKSLSNAVSPASFIAAWRHIHAIFDSVGATNVVWVWCPNAVGFETGVAQRFYPGAAYVDWIGADGYNWAPALPGAVWTSFGDIFSAFYRWGRSREKPLLIGEYGVLEGAPGDKAAWITQADDDLRTRFPAIRAVVYFDSFDDGFNWRVTTSRSALAAFRAFATEPYFSAQPSSEHSPPASA